MKRAAEIEQKIQTDRRALAVEIEALELEKRDLESAVVDLEKRLAMGEAERRELVDKSAEKDQKIEGISASVISAAHALEALMQQSPLTALDSNRLKRIEPFLGPDYGSGPDAVTALGNLYLEEIAFSGQVRAHQGSYIGRNGEDRTGKIVTFGKLTAIYEDGEDVGFLTYSPQTQRFSAFFKRPSGVAQKRIRSYLSGQEDAAPIDISFGGALRRAAHAERVTARTRKGGAVLFSLVLAGLLALIFRIFDKKLARRLRWTESEVAAVVHEPVRWGQWALKYETRAHRLAIATMILCALGVYVRGAVVIGEDDSEPVQVNLVNVVALSPPPIAAQRAMQSMARVSQLAEYVPSKSMTRASAPTTDFEPELVSPSITSPFAGGPADVDITLELTNLMNEDVATGNDVVFESYELDQPPQAVVKIPPPYPHQARERGVEGEVQVKMLVQQDGSVAQVFIVDARPKGLFEEAVRKSLSQWRFSPGKMQGKTVTAWVVTTIHFDLN